MDRKEQKEFLKKIYPDYDARRHDAFVYRYEKEIEKTRIQEYMKNRNIK